MVLVCLFFSAEIICVCCWKTFLFWCLWYPFFYSFPCRGTSCILCCVRLQVCKRTGHEAGFKGAVYIDCPMKPCFLCKMPGSHIYVCVIISLCFWSTRVTNFGCFFLHCGWGCQGLLFMKYCSCYMRKYHC